MHAIENREIGAGIDKAGDPLELCTVAARERQCARDIAGISDFNRICISGAYGGMRRGAAGQRGAYGAERKRQDNGGGRSGHLPGQFVLVRTVPIFVAPVDCRATGTRAPSGATPRFSVIR